MSNSIVPRALRSVVVRDPDVIDLKPVQPPQTARLVWRALFVLVGLAAFVIHLITLLLGWHPVLQ